MKLSKKVAIRHLKSAGKKVRVLDLEPGDVVRLPDFKEVTILSNEDIGEPSYRRLEMEGHPHQDKVILPWRKELEKLN